MEPRLMLAYALIALFIVGAIAWIAFAIYNSHDRKVFRQRAREDARRGER